MSLLPAKDAVLRIGGPAAQLQVYVRDVASTTTLDSYIASVKEQYAFWKPEFTDETRVNLAGGSQGHQMTFTLALGDAPLRIKMLIVVRGGKALVFSASASPSLFDQAKKDIDQILGSVQLL